MLDEAPSLPKRALFLGTPFFDYYRHIIHALNQAGYQVDYHNDRPSESPLVKGMLKISPGAVRGRVAKHLSRILAASRTHTYDLIFVLNGKTFTPEFIHALRENQPKAETVLYMWDSLELYPHAIALSDCFDRAYTFDGVDAENHPALSLLPLFYTPGYEHVGHTEGQTQLDILNVFTAHSNRYVTMQKILPWLEDQGMETYSYMYLQPLQFAHSRITDPAFRGARARDFEFRPLEPHSYLRHLRFSRAVLDVNHVAQSGLTMRTIETIGARRKLITTNRHVVKYPFYNPTRIHVLDIGNLDTDRFREFMRAEQEPIDDEIYKSLSVQHWVEKLVGGRK